MAATILTFCHWSLCGKQKVIEEVRIIIGYKRQYNLLIFYSLRKVKNDEKVILLNEHHPFIMDSLSEEKRSKNVILSHVKSLSLFP